MSDYGVKESGFVTKPQTAIFDSLVTRARNSPALGPNLDYSSQSPLGQLLGLVAGELVEGWELGGDVYASNDPEAAVGVPLDNVMSITGSTRPEESFSRSLHQTVTIEDGTTINAGALISPVGRPDIFFALDETVTNTSGINATLPVTFTCTIAGPVNVAAGVLTEIANPQVGWLSTTNVQDVSPGRDAGSNQEARQLRVVELFSRGSSTVGAIRASVVKVDGVLAATVLENPTNTPGVNGLPPHSFAAVFDDGDSPTADDDEVAQAVYDKRPAGIGSQGGDGGTAVDPVDDSEHAERHTRVTRRDVYIVLTLETSSSFPFDGLQKVREAIVALGDEYQSGESVVRQRLITACFTVAGVVDVPTFTLGFFVDPIGTANLEVGTYERATFDTSRVDVEIA
jgi:hypothetical protein